MGHGSADSNEYVSNVEKGRYGLTLQQGARIWGSSYTTFRELVKAGIVKSYPVHPNSRHRRVTLTSIDTARRQLEGVSDSRVLQATTDTVLSDVPGDQFFRDLFN